MEIENKTNVINEIVFQTKLLSFNASELKTLEVKKAVGFEANHLFLK